VAETSGAGVGTAGAGDIGVGIGIGLGPAGPAGPSGVAVATSEPAWLALTAVMLGLAAGFTRRRA
jgi:hypothetical protein